MFSKAFLRLCCALCVLASCVFISADAQQSTFTLTVTTTGIDSGAVQMRWTSGISGSASVCDAPVPSATCSISNIPSGATVVISSNAPGGSTPGVILSGVPQACIDTSTCTFPIGADTTVHVAFGGTK